MQEDFLNIVGVKKLHPDAQLPKRQREGDAAFDIYAIKDTRLHALVPKIVDCGIALEIPANYKVLIYGRSGLAMKSIFAHVGTVDPNFKGEIGPILVYYGSGCDVGNGWYDIKKGDRVGQIVLTPITPTEFTEVANLSDSERGAEGFGSSGR